MQWKKWLNENRATIKYSFMGFVIGFVILFAILFWGQGETVAHSILGGMILGLVAALFGGLIGPSGDEGYGR